MKFEIFRSTKDGQFYFHLLGANGEPVAQSEGYVDKESAEHTISVIRDKAWWATVEFVGDVETV